MQHIIKLIIADVQPVFREGLKSIFKKHSNMVDIIGETDNGKQLLKITHRKKPDVVLLDIQAAAMNGAQLCRQIRKEMPDVEVIALAQNDDLAYVTSMIDAGAKGFILRSTDPVSIVKSVKQVANGKPYFVAEVTGYLIRNKNEEAAEKGLTKRELEILKSICDGHTTKIIADEMNLSPRTVEHYRQKLMKKARVTTPAALGIWAVRNRFI